MTESTSSRARRALMDACLLTLECHALYKSNKQDKVRETYISALGLMASAIEYLTEEVISTVVEECKKQTGVDNGKEEK